MAGYKTEILQTQRDARATRLRKTFVTKSKGHRNPAYALDDPQNRVDAIQKALRIIKNSENQNTTAAAVRKVTSRG